MDTWVRGLTGTHCARLELEAWGLEVSAVYFDRGVRPGTCLSYPFFPDRILFPRSRMIGFPFAVSAALHCHCLSLSLLGDVPPSHASLPSLARSVPPPSPPSFPRPPSRPFVLAVSVSCCRARIRRRMSFMRLPYALRNTVACTRDGITARIAYIPRAPWTSRRFTVFNYSKTSRPRCSIYVGV